MESDSSRKPGHRKVHLQGDGRPFSLARVTPSATISRMKLRELIEPLELDIEDEMHLLKGTAEIMQGYVGQLLNKATKNDHAASLRALDRISKESVSLAKHLDALQNDFLVAIEDHRRDPATNLDPAPFDFLHLVPLLERLGHAATRARSGYARRARGGPEKKLLDNTIDQFRALFRAVGLEITAKESGSKVERRTLAGSGAPFLIAVFAEFDPHTDQPHLWGAWKRSAQSPADAETTDSRGVQISR